MITGVKLRNSRSVNLPSDPVEVLVCYVREQARYSKDLEYPLAAFKHTSTDQWYFRSSWFDRETLEATIEAGLVEKVETYLGLIESGIITSDLIRGRIKLTGKPPTFYRVKDSKLNELISAKK